MLSRAVIAPDLADEIAHPVRKAVDPGQPDAAP